MKKLLVLPSILLAAASMYANATPLEEIPLYNPYDRPKNGPPLTNIFHKVKPVWLLAKLREPKNHPSARMPDFHFTETEVLDVMAYLHSIAEAPALPVQWPAWAEKEFDEMDDDEFSASLDLADRGKAIWRSARCTICHTVNGPGGRLIGGFVDLRVGGIDLQSAATKLKRDWLYGWIREPKDFFPDTLMPRYRFSDDEIRALVEYILSDDAFIPATEDGSGPRKWEILDEPELAFRGKRLIELSRCVVCHDIKGIPELLSRPRLEPPSPRGSFEFLIFDLRCLTCHSLAGRGGTYAPDLTGEGSRLQGNWIVDFLRLPDVIRPLLQQMPKFNLTAEEAEIIASYIGTRLGDTRIPADISGGSVTAGEIQRGRQVFQARGCFSCHNSGEGPGGVVGPDLARVPDRLRPGYLWFHLKNPHEVNPYSAEPDYGLSDEEVRSLAGYLSTRRN